MRKLNAEAMLAPFLHGRRYVCRQGPSAEAADRGPRRALTKPTSGLGRRGLPFVGGFPCTASCLCNHGCIRAPSASRVAATCPRAGIAYLHRKRVRPADVNAAETGSQKPPATRRAAGGFCERGPPDGVIESDGPGGCTRLREGAKDRVRPMPDR
jgi:hypothetical protein